MNEFPCWYCDLIYFIDGHLGKIRGLSRISLPINFSRITNKTESSIAFKKLNKEKLKQLKTVKLINCNSCLGSALALVRSGSMTRANMLKSIVEFRKI